jgi:hypothetical protein
LFLNGTTTEIRLCAGFTAKLEFLDLLNHSDDTDTPNQGRDTQDCVRDLSASCTVSIVGAPSGPTSSSRETTDKVSPRRLSDQVSNIEDRGGGAELLAVETHSLLHTEYLGVVQSGFAVRTLGLSKQRFSPIGVCAYGLLKVLQSPIDAKRWLIPRLGRSSSSFTTHWVIKKRGRINQSILLRIALF